MWLVIVIVTTYPNNEIVSTELDDASPPENVDFIYMELS